MCECLDYEDGTRHTCEACVDDLELMRASMLKTDRDNESLREKLRVANEQLLAVHAYLADGEIRGAVGGDMAKVFAISLIEFYRASGGANYVEMGIVDTKNSEKFTVLVQRVEGRSPHELRDAAEARAAKLEEALRLIDGECAGKTPCYAKMPTGRAFWCPSCIARAALAPPPSAAPERKGSE